jgi:hypothetical protein
MRLTKSLIAGMTVALIALSSLTLKSNVPGEFMSMELVDKDYTPITGGTELQDVDFILPPNIQDSDDGYHRIDIGFPFEYNGEVYTELWICVNGFVTFDRPNFLPQTNPRGLFRDLPSTYQQNVLAPFWGDHIFRNKVDELNNYVETTISYKGDADKMVIEWKDLNIMDKTKPSSIADFQVILYRSDDPATPQGDIEFAYGQVGGNPLTTETTVVTKGASVGIKGEFDDFMNGLFPISDEPDGTSGVSAAATDSTTLSNAWQPSGASNYRILFTAKKTLNIEEFWGDGDVDFSKTPGQRHFNLPQNRYVTFNDVRLILRSLATQIPLDSVRRRAAYHGDVNHNGRYYFRDNGGMLEKVEIRSQDENYFDNIPNEVTSLKKVFYQVNEHDAAIILQYLSASTTQLPWLIPDEVVFDPKQSNVADNIVIGEKEVLNGNTVVPVFINNNHYGPLSVSFDVNASVNGVRTELNNEFQMTDHGTNSVFFAASAEKFNSNEAVFYVELSDLNGDLTLENIRVNDKPVGTITEANDAVSANLVVTPNPFMNGVSTYSVNVPQEGNYTLSVYDAVGNKVSEIYSGNISSTATNVLELNDAYGNELNSGVYFIKLEGKGVNEVEKVIISK